MEQKPKSSFKLDLKVNRLNGIALRGNPPQSYVTSPAILRSHSVTCHRTQVNVPRLMTARKVDTRFTQEGWKAELI